jgi:hypothetical protein
VLAKLFALGEKMTDLDALLDESELVILPEVEPIFRATGLYSALCKVYSKLGLDAELLEVWSKYAVPLYLHACLPSASNGSNRRLVEGEWVDPRIPDPLSDMFGLLTARRNHALTQQWGVWLAGKDAERALKVGHHAILFFGALRVPDAFHSY